MTFDLFRYGRHGDAAFFVPDHVGGSPEVAIVAGCNAEHVCMSPEIKPRVKIINAR